MSDGCPNGEDLRTVIEKTIKIARKLGNVEAENQLLMALLSLGPRECGEGENGRSNQSIATVVRAIGGRSN